MYYKNIAHLLILLVFLLSVPVWASDVAKEKFWSDQIIASRIMGEPQWLEAKGQKFLGLYTPYMAGSAKGSVILLHSKDGHPNWANVVRPLRTRLPEYGWSTLSIQMPILPNNPPMKDYVPLFDESPARINAAIAFIKSKKGGKIVLLGHGLGATMGLSFLAEIPNSGVKTFVGIGLISNDSDPRLNILPLFEKVTLPILDLYGSQDLMHVVNTAKLRSNSAKKSGNKRYAQIQIQGADHLFKSTEEELIKRVRGWLKRYAR